MADLKLEEYISPKYVEAIKEMVEDHKNLSEKDFYEKYAEAVSGLWDTYEDFVSEKSELNDVLSFFAVHYLLDQGYIVQEDGQADEDYIYEYMSDDIENLWDTNEVKLMNVDLSNDQYYLLWIPVTCKSKKFIKAPMKIVGNQKLKKKSREEILMEKFRHDRSRAFIDSIPKIENLDYRNDFGESYLYAACEDCNYYAVKALLDLGFDPNDVNKFQSYPGRLAALSEHFLAVDVFCLFLEKGINLELPTFRGTIRSDIMDGNNEVMKEAVRMYLEEHKIYPLNREERDAAYIEHKKKVLEEKKAREEAERLAKEKGALEEVKVLVGDDYKYIEEALKRIETRENYPFSVCNITNIAKSIYDKKDTINEMFGIMKQTPEFKNIDIVRVADEYDLLARYTWLLYEDVKPVREYYYLSTLYYIVSLKDKDTFIKQKNAFYINFRAYEMMYYALLSGNFETAKEVADLIDIFEDKDITDYVVYIGMVLKNLILGNEEEVEKWLALIDGYKKASYFSKELKLEIKAMRGINRRDEKMFNEGLEATLKNQEKVIKSDEYASYEYFATNAIGLAMLAKHRGMNITVKHSLLPEGYFVDCDIDYKSIEMNLRLE